LDKKKKQGQALVSNAGKLGRLVCSKKFIVYLQVNIVIEVVNHLLSMMIEKVRIVCLSSNYTRVKVDVYDYCRRCFRFVNWSRTAG